MSRASFVASSLLLLALLPHEAAAGPMETCGEQKDCIKFSTWTEAVPAATCAGQQGAACEWTVCLELNLHDADGNPSCVKSSADTVSHTCTKDAGTCAPTMWAAEVVGIADGHTQCQTGPGGSVLTFLLKDGKGCDAAGLVGDTITAGIPAGSAVACAPSATNFASCTGNAPGKECVWTVTLPDCTTPDETPAPPRDYKCPKGKNVCYTSDCQCVLGSCTPYNGGAALADVLVGYDPASPAGEYAVSGTCENGKALSNSVRVTVDEDTCVKEEPSGADTTFTVTVDAAGDVVTPFSMKCGKDCFLYGAFPWACNN